MNWAIVILLSNYFHDLAVALLLCSLLIGRLYEAGLRRSGSWTAAIGASLRAVARRVAWGSLTWIIIGGIIRTLTYREYEWSEAAGRGQVAALAVKHVVLVALTVIGLLWLWRDAAGRGKAGDAD